MARPRKIADVVIAGPVHTVLVDGKFKKLLKNHRSALRFAKKQVTATNKVQVADGSQITDLWIKGIKVK